MYHLYLMGGEEEEFKERLRSERDVKKWRRLQAVYLRGQRKSTQMIAENLGVNRDTITLWVKLYRSGGLEGLTNLKYEHQGRSSKLGVYQREIDLLTDKERISTMSCLAKRIKELYGVEVEESWLSRWCKKNSICLSRRPD